MTNKLTIQGYDFLEAVGTEEDVLNAFNDYSGSEYICDVISEIADQQTPIYNHELWEMAPKVRDYIESAMEEGLCETPRGGQPDLMKIFQAGVYYYYKQLLYTNDTDLYYNYAATKINEWIETLNYDQKEKLDIDLLDERLEYELGDIDNNSYMEDLEDVAKRIIAEFKGKINKDAAWTNYGDVNALEHGGEFVKKDSDYPTEKNYYIVRVINLENACGGDGYLVEEAYIDLNEDWIDWEAVESTCDIAEGDGRKVVDVFGYYGVSEFNGDTYKFDDETEVLEHLAEKGICIEN